MTALENVAVPRELAGHADAFARALAARCDRTIRLRSGRIVPDPPARAVSAA